VLPGRAADDVELQSWYFSWTCCPTVTPDRRAFVSAAAVASLWSGRYAGAGAQSSPGAGNCPCRLPALGDVWRLRPL